MFRPQSLYIHIPFCLSKCSYCDFFSKPVESVRQSYVDALCNEITWRLGNSFYSSEKLKTVYIGGGTPSLLSFDQLRQIGKVIPKGFLKEFTVELNPDDVRPELLQVLEEIGVNRISCGIQSFNDKVLSLCNRRAHSFQIEKALECFNKHWNKELSLDLISGLPYETMDSFKNGLSRLCKRNVNHISLYSLTLEEGTPMGKQVYQGTLDYDYDLAEKMWLWGKDFLEENGFHQYEVSNFCKDGKESLHNMTYWNHESYLGCGSGGAGTIYRKDGSAFRWTNTSDLKEYESFWNSKKDIFIENIPQNSEELSADIEMFEFFMMGLRKLEGIKESSFVKHFGECIPEKIKEHFCLWQKRGLAEIKESEKDCVYSLGKNGILFLNKFLEELDL